MFNSKRECEINRACRLLEEAILEKQSTRLQGQMASLTSFPTGGGDFLSKMTGKMIRTYGFTAQDIFKDAQRMGKTIFLKWQRQIHQHPWEVLGQVAISSFSLGMVLGYHFQDLQRQDKK